MKTLCLARGGGADTLQIGTLYIRLGSEKADDTLQIGKLFIRLGLEKADRSINVACCYMHKLQEDCVRGS